MAAKAGNNIEKKLMEAYTRLLGEFGPQGWWPGRTRFEVVVGAILTQNTSWSNVERAIRNLKREKALTPKAMRSLEVSRLAELIRPAGYFNIKAGRLGNFLDHLFEYCGGSLSRLFKKPAPELRRELLSVNGIGPETADSIILYAAGKPEFVVDAYTRRVFSRHALADAESGYEDLKAVFAGNLPADVKLFNEYHALIVKVAKDFCRTRDPFCRGCPLESLNGGFDKGL